MILKKMSTVGMKWGEERRKEQLYPMADYDSELRNSFIAAYLEFRYDLLEINGFCAGYWQFWFSWVYHMLCVLCQKARM